MSIPAFMIWADGEPIMNVVIVSRIVGTFLGYAPGVIHRLDDGSEWQQVGPVEEFVYGERPGCRVFWDRERLWINVEGTSGPAQVRKYLGKRWTGAGPL
jgi:hypothetical protein